MPEKIEAETAMILNWSKPKPILAPKPTVFFDRDGTLIKERDFDYTPENIEILPGVVESLRKLKDKGFRIAVVSNQSGVGRGFFSIETVDTIHQTLNKKLGAAAAVDRFYFCPHWPDGPVEKYQKNCFCRKPGTGLLELADLEAGIDFPRSFLVGDRLSDLALGKAKNLSSLLILTGQGRKALADLENSGDKPYRAVCQSLPEAADFILAHRDN